MHTALSNAVDRLEAILVRESDALSTGAAIDLADMTGRKNQSLLEFTRLARGLGPESLEPSERERLANVSRLLTENRVVLERHVRASHEISDLMARAIEDAESDGTYTSRPEFAGRIR